MIEVWLDGKLRKRWDDDTRTYTSWDVEGVQIEQRPYTTLENDRADDRAATEAQLDDHEARIRRIENTLWPPPGDPTSSTDPSIPTWSSLGGIWSDGGLLKDGGKVWRNVSGVPLTTAPTAFPGSPSQWTHLFVEITFAPPPPPTNAWAAGVAYKVNDLVTYGGSTYKCLQAHTSQVGWEPPNVAALWSKQ